MGGRQPALVGVDIGGTKIKAGAVAVGPDGAARHVAAADRIPTPAAAPGPFYDAVASLIRQVQTRAADAGCAVLPIVAVAHPGRFLPDGRLARGTTPNLGTSPNQFDGLSPAQELERRLPVRVFACNDAVAQMRFGLEVVLRDPTLRPALVGQTVVYLGPGTGMGGGVALVSQDGAVEPTTDGHFFDLQVVAYGDGTLTAEELLTGPAIARAVAQANTGLTAPIQPPRAGGLDELLRSPTARPEHRACAQQIAGEFGERLAGLIETIARGTIRKVRVERAADGALIRRVDEPDRAWSAADQALVRGCRRFLLGGFVGSSAGLGASIRDQALARLRRRGLPEVQIIQVPLDSDDAGLLGAVRAVPVSELAGRLSAGWCGG
ncbi:MAG: hypothetical protein A3C53_01925 [Omnitrophica WOR_2 bacterium RIFCSPHIGHO2_02_FULL_68_15]|nr:MAG: hypothetical protein A3C53_01925 [Omnitrophica WOR_2 bacterium RIFCSPHIGHO2_02_FULL_68_15]